MEKLTMDVDSCPYVFVYGTLKQGHGNHRLLEGSMYLGVAESVTEGVLYDWGCPAFTHSQLAISEAPIASVRGELYKVTPDILLILDRLEGHPDFYYRVQIPIKNKSHAWCYFNNVSGWYTAPIVNGCYEWKPEEL